MPELAPYLTEVLLHIDVTDQKLGPNVSIRCVMFPGRIYLPRKLARALPLSIRIVSTDDAEIEPVDVAGLLAWIRDELWRMEGMDKENITDGSTG